MWSSPVEANGVGIDLKQIKTFKPNGSKTFNKLYDGTVIVGTEEACKAEMADVWRRLKGAEGVQMKEKIKKLRAEADQSRKGGQSRRTMEALSQFFD
jgi:hypothetical protein